MLSHLISAGFTRVETPPHRYLSRFGWNAWNSCFVAQRSAINSDRHLRAALLVH